MHSMLILSACLMLHACAFVVHCVKIISKRKKHSSCADWACAQVGASVNETYQAREGMMPDAFPQAIPIYTGHYHKPHTVPNTEIHYIGSPYQGVDLKNYLLANSMVGIPCLVR